ncbi:MAG TPA: ABC transporter permease [Acidimicrobiia bacterium]|nr:ABC transporter permease [Acidimicrobiia bacterium]
MPATTELDDKLREQQRGLDKLELALPQRKSRARRVWSSTWPKLAAIALALAIWQLVFWSGWKSEFILPAPATVFSTFFDEFGTLLEAAGNTLQRAFIGFGISIVLGTAIGAAVATVPVLRAAVGSMLTGLQTMPSIAWFPAAVVLFKLSQGAILFVVVIGATPSIANGLLAGFDTIPPIMLRTGRVLGARGFATLRYVILPAALPSFVAGLKQGWAFAWRSLLAGELLVLIPGATSLGQQLNFSQEFARYDYMYAVMIMILVIGVIIDSLFFATAERLIRKRYGFVDEAAAK